MPQSQFIPDRRERDTQDARDSHLPTGSRSSIHPRRGDQGSSMAEDAVTGLTTTGYRLVLAITALSVAHHVDHILRNVTGWPLGGAFNPFSASLFAYPVILVGVLLSRRQRVGAPFWAVLAGGGALFILAIHVGPAAGDSVTAIPDQYGSTVADVVALVVLALFLTALVWHCAHELRRMTT